MKASIGSALTYCFIVDFSSQLFTPVVGMRKTLHRNYRAMDQRVLDQLHDDDDDDDACGSYQVRLMTYRLTGNNSWLLGPSLTRSRVKHVMKAKRLKWNRYIKAHLRLFRKGTN